MPLTFGTRLGPYEILSTLGAGGMGEVYRARDTRLKREVALKILPESFAADPDRLARFQREAEVLASLNHPNIAAIHGLEEADGRTALVLELVEGPTLADRLATGPLPLDEGLSIARQIADALSAAHEKGIVHRDLKPANIKITARGVPPPRAEDRRLERRLSAADVADGVVKVLDFGLAKVIEGEAASGRAGGNLTNSPTIASQGMTLHGVILGTAAYMAPEQARGAAADRRADIWAFGVVLFEMLRGRSLFEGSTVSDTLASVLKTEPDWTTLPADTPAPIRRLLRRCLEKDRRRRLDSAADARLEIEDALNAPAPESSSTAAPRRTRVLRIGLALLAAGALGAAVVAWAMTRAAAPAAGPPTRLSVNVEPGLHLGEAPREALYQQRPGLTAFALSPDGRQLAYVGHDGKTSQLYVRHLDQERAVAIAGTAGAQSPFFSPDGRELGFFTGTSAVGARDADGAIIGAPIDARGAIRRVAAAGGSVRTVEISGLAPPVFPSATWSADDTLLLAGADGIYRVPAAGGSVERVITSAPGAPVRFPQLLPGGRAILFNVINPSSAPSLADIAVETLDTDERTVLVRGGSFPRFVASGHIVFARSGKLMAIPFDPATHTTRGDPVVVGEDVMQSEEGVAYFRMNGAAQFAFSRSGDLAYVPGGAYSQTRNVLMWVDRRGAAAPVSIAPATMFGASISRDGKRIAFTQGQVGQAAIWVFDVERSVSRRLTQPGGYYSPVWSPDGTRLAAVTRGDDGGPVLAVIDVERGGAPQNLRLDATSQAAVHWPSTDTVFIQRIAASSAGRLATLTLDGTSQVKPLFEWSSPMQYPAFSRDGKCMSYSVNETGAYEVYVRPLPSGTPVHRVSVNGGSSSAWSADGRELFYREGSRMMAVAISTETGCRPLGLPRNLFSGEYIEVSVPSRGFDITPDGRFLVKARGPVAESAPVTSVNLVLNWVEELKRLVPRN